MKVLDMMERFGCRMILQFPFICRLMPLLIMAVFTYGLFSAWVHAQDAATIANSMAIAAVQRQVTDLGNVPEQINGIDQRLAKLEVMMTEQGLEISDMTTLIRWAAFGIFGTFSTVIYQRFLRRLTDQTNLVNSKDKENGSSDGQ